MRVAVVGLGKLGAPLAAVLASKGNDVIGVDVNPEAVRLLNDGRRARRRARAAGARQRVRATGFARRPISAEAADAT